MVLIQNQYLNLSTQSCVLNETSKYLFSHKNAITITTGEEVSKILEVLNVIPHVWSGHPCKYDYPHYEHDQYEV
jgi:hypothetical protein